MSAVVIAGDISGTVTLDAPAAAGSTVLTLPATSGTVARVSGDLGTPSALVGTNITGTANALVAGIGVNQTWQNVTASRTAGVNYTNTSGKPIMVNVLYAAPSPVLTLLYINGTAMSWTQVGGERGTVNAIIPNGTVYSIGSIFGTPSTLDWYELR